VDITYLEIDANELEALAWAVARNVEGWLEHIGFAVKDEPDDEIYFDVLRHDFELPFE
jgi:hypothetical protein